MMYGEPLVLQQMLLLLQALLQQVLLLLQPVKQALLPQFAAAMQCLYSRGTTGDTLTVLLLGAGGDTVLLLRVLLQLLLQLLLLQLRDNGPSKLHM